jgi:hypothetical protein
MISSRWRSIAAVALVACGGTAADVSDGGGSDAASTDAQSMDAAANDASPGDATSDSAAPGYLACMSASGQLDESLKTCQSDSDCDIEREQTDCCGTILYVGVNAGSVAMFDTCEASWVGHFPGCGCDSGQSTTEDGKTTYPGADAGAPQVHCADFTSNGGVCLTYTSP